MELIEIAKRALKFHFETEIYLIKLIGEILEENNVEGRELIMEKLHNTYDGYIIVQSYKEIEKDKTGNSLKEYLDIE